MPDKYEHTASLIMKDLGGTISGAERRELEEWLSVSEENRQLFADFRNKERFLDMLSAFAGMDEEADWTTLTELMPELREPAVLRSPAGLRYRIDQIRDLFSPGKPGAMRWGLALALALSVVILAACWYLLSRRADKGMAVTNHNNMQIPAGSGHPGKKIRNTKATTFLAFADGSRIDLDTIRVGHLIRQLNNVAWFKTDSASMRGKFTGGIAPRPLSYLRLYTARGSSYRLALPDGSQVWLNAESSLQFPNSFDSGGRHVDLQGEAYFEVAHRSREDLFTVHAAFTANGHAPGSMTVEALGTSFNIAAYRDDAMISATLIKGSVTIDRGNGPPDSLYVGQQFQLYPDGSHRTVSIDTQEVMSWKNNKFFYWKTALPAILAQLTRWYDKKFVNADSIIGPFSFTADRGRPLSYIMDLMKDTQYLEWKEEDDKIIITQRSDTMTH